MAALVVLASAPAFTQTLDPRTSTLELSCSGTTPAVKTSFEDISTGQCDSSVGGGSAFGLAEAYLSTPEVFVETYASAYDTAVSAEAKSSIDIQLKINSDAAPPVAIDTVPVFSFVYGEADFAGNSIGSASLTLNGPGYDNSVLALAPPPVGGRISADIEPDEIYTINIAASCFSVSATQGDVSHCIAVMDPYIFFDQAALNAQLGEDSFKLSDYYSIELSSIVPIPASWVLFASALGWLGLVGRRGSKLR